MKCNYCGEQAELKTGEQVYPKRPDLKEKNFYVCEPCDAKVGCHENTTKPLGTLANEELRKMRSYTHTHFDKLWQSGLIKRTNAYTWLAFELNIPFKFAHIGEFNTDLCRKTIGLCKNKLRKLLEEEEHGKNEK